MCGTVSDMARASAEHTGSYTVSRSPLESALSAPLSALNDSGAKLLGDVVLMRVANDPGGQGVCKRTERVQHFQNAIMSARRNNSRSIMRSLIPGASPKLRGSPPL